MRKKDFYMIQREFSGKQSAEELMEKIMRIYVQSGNDVVTKKEQTDGKED